MIVVTAMFFIYSNVNSVEKTVHFKEQPGWFDKLGCVSRGGKLEKLPKSDLIFSGDEMLVAGGEEAQYEFLCHYR